MLALRRTLDERWTVRLIEIACLINFDAVATDNRVPPSLLPFSMSRGTDREVRSFPVRPVIVLISRGRLRWT